MNSKCLKDFNIRPEILKPVKYRSGKILELIGIGSDFLHRTQMTQKLREKIDKWDYIKLESVYTTKERVTTLNRQPTV
jgi:hypothetical protein